jgi:hypothetical protein
MSFSKSFDLGSGVVAVTESEGKISVGITEAVAVGGGEAAGLVSISGNASLVLSAKQAFDLGMALLEAHSPAAVVPLEEGAAAIVDSELAAN